MEIQWKLGSIVKWVCLLLGVITLAQGNSPVTVFPDGVWSAGVGDLVSFTCSVTFYIENSEDRSSTHVTWLKDGQMINFNPRIYDTFDGTRTFSELFINETIAEDSGVYTCSARLGSQEGSDSVTLNIEVEPLNAPKLIEAVCGEKNHATVVWEPGQENNSTVRQYIVEYTDSYYPGVWLQTYVYPHGLSITISMSYGMNYTFRVRAEGVSGIGLPSNHSEICRTAFSTPVHHPYFVKATQNEPVKMIIKWQQLGYNDVSAPGFFYRVFWKAENQTDWMTKDVNDVTETSLVVPTDPNFKLYSAKVESHNSLGKAQDEADVVVNDDVPNAPLLSGVVCGEATARLLWLPMGDNRAPILNFIAEYNTSFTPDDWLVAYRSIPASDFNFQVHLSPWTNYTFRVIAVNKIGPSLPSGHSEQCQTPPDVPYKNPENVEGRGDNPDKLVITWMSMPQIEHNGPGFFYRVFWKRINDSNDDWMTEDIHDWRRTSFVVSNSPTSVPYTIKVEAHNIRGQANVAAFQVTSYTGENNYKVKWGHGTIFSCNSLVDNSFDLEIEWFGKGHLIDFQEEPRMNIRYNSGKVIKRIKQVDSSRYTCVAKTRLDEVTSATPTRKVDVPNAPKLFGIMCANTKALLLWKPMGDNRTLINRVIIEYNTSFTPDIWQVAYNESVTVDDLNLEVTEVLLSPWVNYTFRVIVVNKVGPSLPSGVSKQCETPPDVPFKNPDNVEGKSDKKGNLVISWTPIPQIEHNGPGFFYRVVWKKKEGHLWNTEDINDWKQTSFVVANTPNNTEYTIKVEAYNSLGQANVTAFQIAGYSDWDYD